MSRKRSTYAPLEAAKEYRQIYDVHGTIPNVMDFAERETDLPEPNVLGVAVKAYTMGRWGDNKQAYAISAELAKDLFAMDDCSVPLDAMKLPFPCIYVDIDDMHLTLGDDEVPGYFVLLDKAEYHTQGKPELMCSVVIVTRSRDGDIESYCFVVDIDRAREVYGKRIDEITIEQMVSQACENGITVSQAEIAAHVRNALLCAAYLSSSKPDITENAEQAKIYRPTRDPLRYASVRKWDVGVRYMQERSRTDSVSAEGDEGRHVESRQSPRAHMRKAHWHTYCVGKGRTKRVLLWIPPVAVGMRGMMDGKEVTLTSDDLPTVVRGV